jgi:hypothetical protein
MAGICSRIPSTSPSSSLLTTAILEFEFRRSGVGLGELWLLHAKGMQNEDLFHGAEIRSFSEDFEPAYLGPLEVRNRLIMAPMGSRLANENGGVSPWLIDYYAERAKGGVGTIIVEITGVDSPRGVTSPKTLTIHEDFYIGGHNELVEAVHAHGARMLLQLAHVGRNRRFAMGGQWLLRFPTDFQSSPRVTGEIENWSRNL